MCNLFIVALVGLTVGIIGLVLIDKTIVYIDFCYISIAGFLIAFLLCSLVFCKF